MIGSGNVLGAKVRGMYGRRIRNEQLLEMSRRSSVSDLALYLRDETVYGELLRETNPARLHRGQLENLLKSGHYARCQRLLKYSKGRRGFFSFITEELEIQNILYIIRLINAGHPESFIPGFTDFDVPTKGFDLAALPAVRTLAELMRVLEGTPYHGILEPFLTDETAAFDQCETALYNYYYNRLRQRITSDFRGRDREELLSVFDFYTALSNIGAVLRIKRYFPHIPPEDIHGFLLPPGDALPKSFWSRLCRADSAKEADALVRVSRFGKYLNEEEPEPDVIRLRGKLCRRLLRFSVCNEVIFTAFLMLDLLEIANITVIVEGIRYGLDAQEIQKMIIFD